MRLIRWFFILSSVTSVAALTLLVQSWGIIAGYGWLAPAVIALAAAIFAAAAILLYRPDVSARLLQQIDGWLSQRTILAIAFFTLLILFLTGLIYWGSASPVLYGPVYPVWLAPFFAWVVVESLIALAFLARLQRVAYLPSTPVLILLLAIMTSGVLVNLRIWDYPSPRKEDIYYTYLDGQRLLQGENPYARVLSGDMRVNEKYSTYFPIFYGLSGLVQRLGLEDFPTWLSFWRVIFMLFNLSIALLLFWIAGSAPAAADQRTARGHWVALAAFSALFWLFNRWTLHVSQTADIDFIPLFLLLLSLYLFPRHRITSFLLLGVSLGVKQMGIFLVSLYLIWSWQAGGEHRSRAAITAAIWIAAIPLLTSLPFLAWNSEGFIRSIAFSATRDPSVAFEVYSLDTLLGIFGLRGKLFMLALLALLYWAAGKEKIGAYTAALLVMGVFVFFNSVMFTSYLMWLVPLMPLAAVDLLNRSRSAKLDQLD